MKVLLFAGAGTSIELGVPGMTGLASDFVEHSRQWTVQPDLVKRLMGEILDVECLIEKVDRICDAREPLETIDEDVIDFERAYSIRAEVEWFVQHAAERVATSDAVVMWGSVLRAARGVGITIVTTNYDRAIEMAANGESVSLDDGFSIFEQRETAPWRGFGCDRSRTSLVKLHGSTDWYSDHESGQPTKLRHPMPLFGRSVLHLSDGKALSSAIVLPSREKLLTRPPYLRLSQAFLNAADACDLAVFVGSSLRDDHVRDAARSVARRGAPVFIVNPDGDNLGVERSIGIAQHASLFLVSTLPNALQSAAPADVLQRAGRSSGAASKGILAATIELLDKSATREQRCRAVEELYGVGATLDSALMRELLADNDPVLARYVLGLVPSSTVKGALIKQAKECRHNVDASFREDPLVSQETRDSRP